MQIPSQQSITLPTTFALAQPGEFVVLPIASADGDMRCVVAQVVENVHEEELLHRQQEATERYWAQNNPD